ncbi:hypothetical protein CJO36_04410 [Megasphaera elsdenii]|jgi:hypothetical protein|uniref:phage replisome organizer N-terminal domain-containing protein n=1 Tax=Megasphaera elsdenii TaxID=907 RepID=UPI000BA757D1|nr:phage replisome organizer N-terminal domain-containing protein [Megasphaera elsdenii]PAK20142.1 hypothetical protein CJO36_04410 [Megasphaera elsdenii]
MAINDTRKYYFLQFSNEFVTDPNILLLKKTPGGKAVAYVYIELMLLAGPTNGVLVDLGIFPDFSQQLSAQLQCISSEEVSAALNYFQKIGYVTVSDNQYYFNQAAAMTVSRTGGAIRKQAARNRAKIERGTNVPKLSLQCPDGVPKLFPEHPNTTTDIDVVDNSITNNHSDVLKKGVLEKLGITNPKLSQLMENEEFKNLSLAQLMRYVEAAKDAVNPAGYVIRAIERHYRFPDPSRAKTKICPKCHGSKVIKDKNGEIKKCPQCLGSGKAMEGSDDI